MSRSVALIYPHQLFEDHPALSSGRDAYLIEDPLFFGTDSEQPLALHGKKLMLHRAAMQSWLAENGGVTLIPLPDEPCRSDELLEKALPEDVNDITLVEPADYLLDRRLRRFAKARGITINFLPTPMFLTPQDWADEVMDGMKKPFMKIFYERQRSRMNILLEDDGKPVGGKWSYDADNRKKLPKSQAVPEPSREETTSVIKEARKWVKERFPDAPGSLGNFTYPVTPAEARDSLDLFLTERFRLFGDYEDAISTQHRVIFHSVLTPALNCGLITPMQVVEAALSAAEKDAKIPLNALEGFIRQVIGWREFMHIIYRRHGVFERKENFWGFTREMPQAFYDGTTGIEPVDHAIRGLLDDAYSHHIERLMVIGNFMLLCRIHPDAVYKWFMELYIDAYDWVMVPNVYGMSQFSDGGVFSTKPYISGSNYIRKMSDFKKGDWCDVWDGLYWSFIADHREFFADQYRLSMMVRLLDNMPNEKREGHRKVAEDFLDSLS